MRDEIDCMQGDIYKMDARIIHNNQYSRRENLIISGIPSHIMQEELEKTVIDILRTFGLKRLSSYEIVGCHRLYNHDNRYPAKTIVRFTNRKMVEYCLRNRDHIVQLKNELKMNLRFYENLCPDNERILKEVSKLSRENVITYYVVRNGFVKVKVSESDRLRKIGHMSELKKMLPDYYNTIENIYDSSG